MRSNACGRTSQLAPPRTSPTAWHPYLDLGYRHLIAGIPSMYDEESMMRFITEVKPLLERG